MACGLGGGACFRDEYPIPIPAFPLKGKVRTAQARDEGAQALASSDYTLMEKQRIRTFSRDVFDQLRALRWQ